MAFVRSKDGVVIITDASGAAKTITTFVDGVDDTLESEILDTTTFGSAYKSSTRGFIGYSGSIKGKWDANGSLTPEFFFNGLITANGTVTSTLAYYPNGSAAAKPYTSAAVYFSNYAKSAPVDDIVTWSVDFQLANGSVVLGTL